MGNHKCDDKLVERGIKGNVPYEARGCSKCGKIKRVKHILKGEE